MVPPAALAIHLCIGMVYGLSAFWLPLSQAVGVTHAVACPAGSGTMHGLFPTDCDWTLSEAPLGLGFVQTLVKAWALFK